MGLKVPVKRDLNQFDSAHYFAAQLQNLNQEDSYAFSADARVLLKEKRDAEALKEALKAKEISPNEGYVQATLALVYHFTGNIKERDAALAKAGSDSSMNSKMAYIKDIISGKEKFRN